MNYEPELDASIRGKGERTYTTPEDNLAANAKPFDLASLRFASTQLSTSPNPLRLSRRPSPIVRLRRVWASL